MADEKSKVWGCLYILAFIFFGLPLIATILGNFFAIMSGLAPYVIGIVIVLMIIGAIFR